MTQTRSESAAPEIVVPEPFDPYALPPSAVQDPPRGIGVMFRQIGPGLILAGTIVGTGELIQTTHVGARVGFTLLWLVILSCFIKVFVQVELGRYAIASGRPTMEALKDVGGWGNFVGGWWVVMTLVTQLQVGAMIGGIGQAMHLALPNVTQALFGQWVGQRPELPWAVLVAVGTAFLLAAGGYGLVEKVSTALVVSFTVVTLLCVALLPAAGHAINWGDVSGGFAFRLPMTAIAAAVAMFGITGVGASELVAYPYWCIEKGYARKTGPRDDTVGWLERARGWLRVMQFDAWVSMAIYTLATLAFYFLGASVLHGRGSEGLPGNVAGMTEELRHMYSPVLGERGAKWFIIAGVFAVLYSTLYGATAANSRAITDFMRVNRLASFRGPEDRTKWVRRFCVFFPIADLFLFAAIGNPVVMVTIGGFVQALTLPMLGAAAIYLRYRRTDARLTAGRLWDVMLWLSVAALLATAVIGLVGVWGAVKKMRA